MSTGQALANYLLNSCGEEAGSRSSLLDGSISRWPESSISAAPPFIGVLYVGAPGDHFAGDKKIVIVNRRVWSGFY